VHSGNAFFIFKGFELMAKDKDGLTIKQKKFCLEYRKSGNAANACRLAGYKAKDIDSMAYQVLHKTSVQKYLSKIADKLEAKCGITAEKVLTRLWKIQQENKKDRVHAIKAIQKQQGYEAPVKQSLEVKVDLSAELQKLLGGKQC
jgi:phage terminase small subunit